MEDRLAASILELLAQRSPDATICPSEAARAVAETDDWRSLVDPARRAAARLADAGEVEVTQGGKVVDVRTATGPVRIRKVR